MGPRVRVAILGLLLACGIWFLPRVAPLAQAREQGFLVDPIHVDAAVAPDWFEGAIEEQLRASLAELAPTPLRDDREVNELVASLQRSSGWIGSIDRVEKRYPNRLEIEVALREPVVLLRSAGGLVLVDAEGFVVAPADEGAAFLAMHELPLLHGVEAPRDAEPGLRIRDERIDEGLRVACELAPHQESLAARDLGVAVINLLPQERLGGRAITEVELYTRSGLAIEWGRSSTHPRFGALEPTPDVKVRGLLRVAAFHPELAGIRRIRAQFDPAFVVFDEEMPVAAAPSPRSPSQR